MEMPVKPKICLVSEKLSTENIDTQNNKLQS